jgi:hypothetical protein
MMMLSRLAFLPLVVLTVLTGDTLAADADSILPDGAIAATGNSPLNQAPPLREMYLKYPIQQLESGFAEGMGSRHRGMPQIQFSIEEVAAILDYLGSITGIPPSQRLRFDIPDEIPP